MHKSDVVVIGAGIIGLLTARELIKTGASVTLLEKGECGRESSWAGGGILFPLYPWWQPPAIMDLVLPSLTLYPQLAAQLFESTRIDVEWTQTGLLITQNSDVDLAMHWCVSHGLNVQKVSDVPQVLSGLQFDLQHQPLFFSDVAQVRNPCLLKALKQDLLHRGVNIVEHCHINAFTLEHGLVRDVHSNCGKFLAGEFILATGAWTRSVFQQLLMGLIELPDIFPAKGQMLLFDTPPQTLKHIVLHGERYLVPRRDGKILVGSTVERDVFHKSLTLQAHEELSQFAIELLPVLKTMPMIKHWAGLRPASPTGVPYIGRVPEVKNLSVNAGHFRNGLAMAPASAHLLVDLLLGRSPCVNPAPYQFSGH